MARFWGGHHTSGTFRPGKLACAFLRIKKNIMCFSITKRTESASCRAECLHVTVIKKQIQASKAIKAVTTNKALKAPVSSAHRGSVRSALVKQVCRGLAGQVQSATRLSSAIHQVWVTTTEFEPHFLKAWTRRSLVDSRTEPKPLIFKPLH